MNTPKPTRREFLKTVGMSAAALPVSRMSAFAQTAPGQPPNVLFIAIDDLNDWIGVLRGHPQAQTPNLDRLARRGVLFTNAHCPAPACNPCRTAVMTGIRPSTSGVYRNKQPWYWSPALQNVVTLPQHFINHGYQAVGGGKIYHGGYPDPNWPGYDVEARPGDPRPPKNERPLNGIIPFDGLFDWGPLEEADNDMGDWNLADWAVDQFGQLAHLGQLSGQPFFLACGFFRPHLPWYVPQKYFDMYPLDELRLPKVNKNDLRDVPRIAQKIALAKGDHEKVLRHGQWKRAVQGYLSSISFVDACVGRVVAALNAFSKDSPYLRNTIIVLWSDHGWHLGEKLHWRKFALWEESTRVPLMFVAPGVTRLGGRCNAPVNLIDIYPTLIDLCGLPSVEGVEGTSLLPLLVNPKSTRHRPALTTIRRNNHSIRSERWRYIRYRDGTEELYDHERDPLEWTNLAEDGGYKSIKRELAQWLPETNAKDSPSE